MKRKKNQIKIAVFLGFTLFCFCFNFTVLSRAQVNNIVVNPTPQLVPKPAATQTPKPPIIQPQKPNSTAGCLATDAGCLPFKTTVAATPTPAPTPPQYKTLWEVQAKIQSILTRNELQRGQVGVKIVSLDTGKTVFDVNAEKYFMPASNMKSYTIAAAMEKLSPDFRSVTSVYAPAKPDASGTIRGDLIVYGRGDVSFSTAFYDGDYYKGLDALATRIAQAGVKRIEGNLVGDESYFSGNPIPEGWEWDDLQWYYGAEISALPVNDNAVDLSVGASSLNAPCAVQMLPTNALMKIVNRCTTTAASIKRSPQIVKKLDQNVVEISGTMPIGDKPFKGYIAVTRPAALFVEMLRGLLIQKGITITGQNRVVNAKDIGYSSPLTKIEIAKLESPPFSLIAAKTLKPSQNTYTETILRVLGREAVIRQFAGNNSSNLGYVESLPDPKADSAERGIEVVKSFLQEIGVAPDSVIQYDGSGLSRHDLITPASAVQLYSFMSKSRYANAWRDALTIGAVDGTLQNRFKGTAAAGNVRGKTGTIDQVSSLSGYVTTASGEKLVFSIIINGVNDVKIRQAAIDEIVVALASFNGRTN